MTEQYIVHRTCGFSHFNCRCGLYVMPFGKFKGKTLRQISFEDGGDWYLKWCAENLTQTKTQEFVESFLVMEGKR